MGLWMLTLNYDLNIFKIELCVSLSIILTKGK